MGRVRTEIKVDGRQLWTRFDSGARNTYVVRGAVEGLVSWDLPVAQPSSLGGQTYNITRMRALIAQVEGYWVETHARIIEGLGGDEKGRPIEVLFGALAMQEWGIELDLRNEKLDLTHYSREFQEF